MQTVTLQQTDLEVSRIALGTMTFGSQADEAASIRMVERAIEAGINFFDTANLYNRGTAEVFTGRALKGKRQRAILASKVGFPMGDGPEERGLARAAILGGCEASLKRLDTDYLDIYYLHVPDAAVDIEETLEALDELVRQGKVRYPACSNYAGWQVVEMLWIARRRGFAPIRVTQPMYNLLARGIEAEYLPMTRRFGLSNIVYNPLAGGLLTGKQTAAAPLAGSRFDNNPLYLGRYWHEDFFRAVEALKPAAEREGRTLASLALNWVLHHTSADCVLVGASRLEQLEENLKALDDGPLSEKTLRVCDRVWARVRGVTPQYNR